ncbi:hypothetical protein PCE1_001015 [Barthelona sp. PCE]
MHLPFSQRHLEDFFFDQSDFIDKLTSNTGEHLFFTVLREQLTFEESTELERASMDKLRDVDIDMFNLLRDRSIFRQVGTNFDVFMDWIDENGVLPSFAKPSFVDIDPERRTTHPNTLECVSMRTRLLQTLKKHNKASIMGSVELSKYFNEDIESYTRAMIVVLINNMRESTLNKVSIFKRYFELSKEEDITATLPSIHWFTLKEIEELVTLFPEYQSDVSVVSARFSRMYTACESTGWDIDMLEQFDVGSLTAFGNGLKYAALYAKHDLNMEITMDELSAFIATGCVRDAGLAVRKQVGDRHVTEFVVQCIRFFDCLPVSSIDLTLIEHWVLRAFMKEITYPRDKDHFGDVCMDFLEKVQFRATLYIGGEYQKYQKYDHLFQSEINRETFMFLKKLKELPESEESITIPVMIKNIPELEVRVYHLNSELLAKDGITPSVAMDLSGWIPNSIEKYSYDSPVHIAHDEEFSFDLPKRCYRIVDFVSKDKSWRVLIKKGLLSISVTPDADGQMITVYSSVPEKIPARVHIGNTVYEVDSDGSAYLPFFSSERTQRVIVEHNDFWQFDEVTLFAQKHNSKNAVVGLAQMLIPGSQGSLLVNPCELANGVFLGNKNVVSRTAVVKCIAPSPRAYRFDIKDVEGIAELRFDIPLDATIVQVLINTEYQLNNNVKKLETSASFDVISGISTKLYNVMPVGRSHNFRLDVRSVVGESLENVELKLKLHSDLLPFALDVVLASDDNGTVTLGDVSHFTKVDVQGVGSFEIPFSFFSQSLKTIYITGRDVYIPIIDNYWHTSLNRVNESLPIKHHYSLEFHSDMQCLRCYDLDPGMYRLRVIYRNCLETTVLIHVLAIDSVVIDNFAYCPQMKKLVPLHDVLNPFMLDHDFDQDGLHISTAFVLDSTKVHAIATCFNPNISEFLSLLDVCERRKSPNIDQKKGRVLYTSNRKLSSTEMYVSKRQTGPFRRGVGLSHPTALLQPMDVGTASNAAFVDFEGENFEMEEEEKKMEFELVSKYVGGSNPRSRRRSGRMQEEELRLSSGFLMSDRCIDGCLQREPEYPGVVNALTFLESSFKVAIDVPIIDGHIVIPAELYSSNRIVTVVLEDRAVGSFHLKMFETALNSEPIIRSVVLDCAFDTERKLTHSFECDFGEKQLKEGTTTRVYDDLKDLWILFRDFYGLSILGGFDFLLENLSAEEMKEKLHTYWCDEVAFFIMIQRPDLFDTCVRPFLHHKLDRNMLENIMLYLNNPDHLIPMLQKYREPTYKKKLSVFERILLAALTEENITQFVDELHGKANINKMSNRKYSDIFKTALNANTTQQKACTSSEEIMSRFNVMNEEREQKAQEPRSNKSTIGADFRRDSDGYIVLEDVSGRERFRSISNNRERLIESLLKSGQKVRIPVYRPPVNTKKYVETSWHGMKNDASHNIFQTSHFWVDFARHIASIPFEDRFQSSNWSFKSSNMLSLSFPVATYHEIIFALALCRTGGVIMRLFNVMDDAESTLVDEKLVIRQQIFDTTTRDLQTDHFMTAGDDLIINRIYKSEIVCFNLSSKMKEISVIRQVPLGAVALDLKNTSTDYITVKPFKAAKVSFFFVIPAVSEFYMCPASICNLSCFMGRADALSKTVVRAFVADGAISWRHISLRGSLEEVCVFLRENDVEYNKYSYCYWRANDCAEAFNMLASTFTELGHFDAKFMRLAFKFKNERFMRLYFKHERPSSASVLKVFKCQLFEVNHPEYRFQEFEPYVTQRVFSLGDYWQSQEVRNKYVETLELLVMSPKPDPILCVYAAYYMLLVERFTDAEKYMARVPAEHDTPFSDLIRAYLDVINGDLTVARELVKKHEDVTHLRLKPHFKEIDLLIRELDGEDVSKYQTVETFEKDDHMAHRSRQQEIGLIEEIAKYLNLKAGKNCVTIDSDFEAVSLLFYPLEAEILFSNKPFDINDATRKPLISPAVTLETTEKCVPIPEEISNNSVIVEARGSGVSKRVIVHPAKFDVELRQKAGILVAKLDGAPLPRLYCKVYKNPGASFLKDGYTDRRGAFDYFSVSTGDPSKIKRLAVYISSPDYGHAIVEAKPPTM